MLSNFINLSESEKIDICRQLYSNIDESLKGIVKSLLDIFYVWMLDKKVTIERVDKINNIMRYAYFLYINLLDKETNQETLQLFPEQEYIFQQNDLQTMNCLKVLNTLSKKPQHYYDSFLLMKSFEKRKMMKPSQVYKQKKVKKQKERRNSMKQKEMIEKIIEYVHTFDESILQEHDKDEKN